MIIFTEFRYMFDINEVQSISINVFEEMPKISFTFKNNSTNIISFLSIEEADNNFTKLKELIKNHQKSLREEPYDDYI